MCTCTSLCVGECVRLYVFISRSVCRVNVFVSVFGFDNIVSVCLCYSLRVCMRERVQKCACIYIHTYYKYILYYSIYGSGVYKLVSVHNLWKCRIWEVQYIYM